MFRSSREGIYPIDLGSLILTKKKRENNLKEIILRLDLYISLCNGLATKLESNCIYL